MNKKDPYPLKNWLDGKRVHLKNGWYIYTKYRSLDVEKMDGRYSPCIGWIENYDGNFYLAGDLPAYIQKLYYKWLCENTVLSPMFTH